MKVLIAIFLSLWGVNSSLAATELTSVYSQIQIKDQCQTSYHNGLYTFKELAFNNSLSASQLDAEIQKESRECHFAFSLGSYDAQNFLAQTYLLEYLLESEQLSPYTRQFQAAQAKLKDYFQEKFQKILMPEANLVKWKQQAKELGVLENLKQKFYELAKEKNEAIPFGRFIFTTQRKYPYTAYDFSQSQGFSFYSDNSKTWLPGSYQRKVSNVLKEIQETASTYLEWKPGIFFSEDSFWHGSLRRIFTKEKSYRELLEEKYFQDMDHWISQASKLHMEMKDLYQIRSLMLKKQKAYLDRDLKVYEKTKYALYAAPLIPLGISLGAAGLASAGLASTTGTTGALTAGGLLSAQNVAALSSLAVLTGMAGYGAYQNLAPVIKGEQPFRLSHALDSIVATTITSFPIALMAPLAVGGTAYTGKMFIGSVKPFLASIGNLYKTSKTLGASGVLKSLPKLPVMALKAWATGWWKNKILFVHYFVNLGVNVVFEIGTREAFMKGEDRFFARKEDGSIDFNPLNINHNSKYALLSSAVMGAVGMPINVMDNFISRFLMWRSLSLLGGISTQILLKGEIDPKKISFDTAYGSTVGTVSGEFSRTVKFSSYFDKMEGKKRAALLFLFGFAMKTGTAPLSISLREAYEDSEEGFGGLAKELFKNQAGLDLGDYEDHELTEAFLRVEQTELEDLLEIYRASWKPEVTATTF